MADPASSNKGLRRPQRSNFERHMTRFVKDPAHQFPKLQAACEEFAASKTKIGPIIHLEGSDSDEGHEAGDGVHHSGDFSHAAACAGAGDKPPLAGSKSVKPLALLPSPSQSSQEAPIC